MMNDNLMYNSIETDRDISTILGQFSQDTIEATIIESLNYKFRPYNNRMPNLPYVIYQNFEGILNNCAGSYDEEVKDKFYEVLFMILHKLCDSYNLQLVAEVPLEQLYSLVYSLYQITVSDFTDRVLSFFSDYIISHKEELVKSIPDDQKLQRSAYTKKTYNSDPISASLYENMDKALDIVAALDFPFYNIMQYLSDEPTANFISSYIADCGNFYKNHISSYIRNGYYRTDVLTSIKIKFAQVTIGKNLITPDNNPYIV